MAFDAEAPVQSLRRHADSLRLALKGERSTYWTHWRELSDYMLPRRGQFLVMPNQPKGQERNQRILNSAATLALRVAKSGLKNGLTSPARRWFQLTVDGDALKDSGPVKIWLDQVQALIERVLSKSNIYNNLDPFYEELLVFGTAVMLIEEDFEDIIHTQTLSVGEYMLALNDKGRVDTIVREFNQTVGQLAKWFGVDKLTPASRALYAAGKVTTEVAIVQLIEPNNEALAYSTEAKGKPFRSVYYEVTATDGEFLSVKGYNEFPAIAVRWDVIGNDTYGRSPGMDVLPDVRQLQSETKTKGTFIQKGVNPPMVAPPEMMSQPQSTLPGGTTYIANPDGKRYTPAYEVNAGWLAPLREDLQGLVESIRQGLFNDIFMAFTQMDGVQPRNELEINKRDQEKLLQLGPVLERMGYEGLSPMIERVYAICERARLIPPAPQELHGKPLDIDYISILAQAQRAVATSAIEQSAKFVGGLAGINPTVLDKMDFDEMVDEYNDLIGLPAKITRDQETVDHIRAERQQQQAQAQAIDNAQKLAVGAQTLSKTDVGGGRNALSAMTGIG